MLKIETWSNFVAWKDRMKLELFFSTQMLHVSNSFFICFHHFSYTLFNRYWPAASDEDSGPSTRRPRCPRCSTRFSTALALFEHMRHHHFASTPSSAPAVTPSTAPSAPSSMANLDTQCGRIQTVKSAFRKANADEKLELMQEALDSLSVHAIGLGLKVKATN